MAAMIAAAVGTQQTAVAKDSVLAKAVRRTCEHRLGGLRARSAEARREIAASGLPIRVAGRETTKCRGGTCGPTGRVDRRVKLFYIVYKTT